MSYSINVGWYHFSPQWWKNFIGFLDSDGWVVRETISYDNLINAGLADTDLIWEWDRTDPTLNKVTAPDEGTMLLFILKWS